MSSIQHNQTGFSHEAAVCLVQRMIPILHAADRINYTELPAHKQDTREQAAFYHNICGWFYFIMS